MAAHRYLPLMGLLLLSGCLYHVREQTDQVAVDLAAHAFDPAPTPTTPSDGAPLPTPRKASTSEDAFDSTAKGAKKPLPDWDVQTTSYLQAKEGSSVKDLLPPKLNIPDRVPGSEAELIKLPADKEKLADAVRKLYPPLPPLPKYPKGDLGPRGSRTRSWTCSGWRLPTARRFARRRPTSRPPAAT